jgi:hypothetical protein
MGRATRRGAAALILVLVVAACGGGGDDEAAPPSTADGEKARVTQLLATALPELEDLPDGYEMTFEKVDVDDSGRTEERGDAVDTYTVCPDAPDVEAEPDAAVQRQFLDRSEDVALPNVFVNLYRYPDGGEAFAQTVQSKTCDVPHEIAPSGEYERTVTALASEPVTEVGDDATLFRWTRHYSSDSTEFDLTSRYYLVRVGPYLGTIEFVATEAAAATPLDTDAIVRATAERLAQL